jgi:hypothetical protein
MTTKMQRVRAPASSKLLMMMLLASYICASCQQMSSDTISGTTYFPSSCATKCREGSVEVQNLTLDPGYASNPAGKWSFVMLSAVSLIST